MNKDGVAKNQFGIFMEKVEEEAKVALGKYVESELRLATESYRYLGEVNMAAAVTYEGMANKATHVLAALDDVKAACKYLFIYSVCLSLLFCFKMLLLFHT